MKRSNTIQTTKKEAETMGAIAFFGDKYGDRVRVVRAGAHSLEFCGGTHVDRLGDIGQIQIVSESSIGSNTRRIEGVSAMGAYQRSHDMETALDSVASILKSSIDDVVPALERVLERQRDFEKELSSLRQAQLSRFAEELHAQVTLATSWWRGSTAIPVSSCARSPPTCNAEDAGWSCWSGRSRTRCPLPWRVTDRSTPPPRVKELAPTGRRWWGRLGTSGARGRTRPGRHRRRLERGGGAVALDGTTTRRRPRYQALRHRHHRFGCRRWRSHDRRSLATTRR